MLLALLGAYGKESCTQTHAGAAGCAAHTIQSFAEVTEQAANNPVQATGGQNSEICASSLQ